ncbi:uncharacterized protein LODBEIA_P09100 [Lodderomyces beijingensis]|uniref:proline--tRNA ligase n=1 Tax=Lodderomyces beijingensis TaxID=1775926 RepID=A0ABP0ZEU7_9ASCO
MIKRVPKLYCEHLNKLKIDRRLPTAELLAKLGIVSYPHSGLVNWTKTGLLTLDKISSIIRKSLDSRGYEELRLSLLSHKDAWVTTERWFHKDFFKIKDENFLLVPTAEEPITEHMKRALESYKQLPLTYYQINQKFRKEKRARGGLLRGKEFLMKDAYSFDVDEASALKTYEDMTGAYHEIFQNIGVSYVRAQADSGSIGGEMSHEWHLSNETGEDTIFTCDSCGHVSNIEKTLSLPTDEQLQNWGSGDVSVAYFTNNKRDTLVCAYYPADRVLEPKFLLSEIPDLDITDARPDSEKVQQFETMSEADMNASVVRVMDARLNSRSNFPDFPIKFANRSMITTLTDVPIVSANEGEVCGECEDGTLTKSKAIEIGHTFYLDDKYSKPMELKIDVPTEKGIDKRYVKMGCYGIGVSRLVGAVAEINRDDGGLRWPRSIAPWEVTVVSDHDSSKIDEMVEQLSRLDYRWDDRNEPIGKKIRESNIMGIPLVVVLGKNYPVVEIEVRGTMDTTAREQIKQASIDAAFHWEIAPQDHNHPAKHFVDKDHLVHVVNKILVHL